MGFALFIKDYFVWHYSQSLKDGLDIWKNFLQFFKNFFSIGLLFRTLFAPWRRMREYYGRGFDPQKYLETLVINIAMRLVGFFMRSAIIAIGLVVELAVLIAGAVVFIIWIFFPVFVAASFVNGLMTLF